MALISSCMFSGNHGGGSSDEVTAALFAHSNLKLFSSELEGDSVSQVDLVPTLATLLGIPIPFSNLGALIPDLLPVIPSATPSVQQLAKHASWSNVKQISDYVEKYGGINDDLSSASTAEILQKYQDLKKRFENPNEDTHSLIKNAHELVLSIRAKFAQIWAKFDEFAMTWGLIMTILSLVLISMIIEGLPGNQLTCALSTEYLMLTYGSLAVAAVSSWVITYAATDVNFHVVLFVTSCACSLLSLMLLFFTNVSDILERWKNPPGSRGWSDILSRQMFVFTLLGMASNSYIVEESSVLFFTLSSLVLVLVFSYKLPKDERKSVSSRRSVDKTTFGWLKTQVHPVRAKLLAVAVLLCVILKVSQSFWRCREEQSWCQQASVKAATEDGEQQSLVYKNVWLSLRMLLCTALWVTVTRMWLRSGGNLTGFSFNIVLLVRYVPTALAVCSGGFWVLQGETSLIKRPKLNPLPLVP